MFSHGFEIGIVSFNREMRCAHSHVECGAAHITLDFASVVEEHKFVATRHACRYH